MTRYSIDTGFDPALFAGSSCAFGVFDGLHRGHRFLIDQACATAGDGRSMAITFDRDPDELFHPGRLQKLMTNEDRLAALEASGVDDLVILPSTPEFFSLEPLAFLKEVFDPAPPAHLHVGENFRFGAKAAGTVDTLRRWGAVSGTRIHSHPLVNADGTPISSTRIRLLLQESNDREARKLLGHDL